MRFQKPKHGATRMRTRFLFFHKTINGETRWFEWATWVEKYTLYGDSAEERDQGTFLLVGFWEPVRWVDDGDAE